MMRSQTLLLLILLFAYNVNLRQVSSHDTYASRFVPLSVLRDGDLVLDEFVPDVIRQQAGDDFFSDYFIYVRGHFYDSHPPIGPFLALPVYAVPAWIGIPARPELAANLLSKLAASLMAALSALAIYAGSRAVIRAGRFAGDVGPATGDRETRAALVAAVAYGLGTSVWSTASQAMWTHTPAILGIACALWALTRGWAGAAGLCLAAAVIARPATAPAAALIGVFVAHRALSGTPRARADLVRFAALAAIAGLAGMAYNLWLFGNLTGGASFRTAIWMAELDASSMFAGSPLAGLTGLTVSPNRGIFVYSPIALIGVAGAVAAWRARVPSTNEGGVFGERDAVLLLRYASLAALSILITYSTFIAWWGGHGFGPRYLTDAMPFVGVLFAAGFARLAVPPLRRLLQVAAGVLLAYSIFIQAVGAFCWPSTWTLEKNPPYRFRLWDWRGSEIEMCLREGPRIDPAAQRLLDRFGF